MANEAITKQNPSVHTEPAVRVPDAAALCAWFMAARRVFPWRSSHREPYRVWISEIMLQQTQAQTVIPYFERFMKTFPDVERLAAADEQQVLKLWEGLGYYSRARNLLRCARQLVSEYGGRFPKDEKALLKLPGIGRYTAGAILSLAFSLPQPAVDGNVLRVLSRVSDRPWQSANPADLKRADRFMRDYYAAIDFQKSGLSPACINEALIELGATLCLPRTPDCERCPLKHSCLALKNDTTAERPLPKASKTNPSEHYTVLILENVNDTSFYLEQRPDSGLLAGLWQFPMLEDPPSVEGLEDFLDERGLSLLNCTTLPSRKHIFSHLNWLLEAFHCRVKPYGLEEHFGTGALLFGEKPLNNATSAAGWFGRQNMLDLPVSSAMQFYRELL